MKKKRFSVEHIAGILKAGDLGAPISELCRPHDISEQSYFRWRKLNGNMDPSEARELRQLRRGEREAQVVLLITTPAVTTRLTSQFRQRWKC